MNGYKTPSVSRCTYYISTPHSNVEVIRISVVFLIGFSKTERISE